MKITGTSNERSISLTASRPEDAIGQLDVGQDDARPLRLGERDRFLVGAGDAEHAMAEALDQPFEIERDESLVLDDQHVGGDFLRELAAGILDQRPQLRYVDVEHLGGVVLRQAFQRDQQKRLPRHGGDLRQMTLDRRARFGGARSPAIYRHRIPDFGEQAIESDTG